MSAAAAVRAAKAALRKDIKKRIKLTPIVQRDQESLVVQQQVCYTSGFCILSIFNIRFLILITTNSILVIRFLSDSKHSGKIHRV